MVLETVERAFLYLLPAHELLIVTPGAAGLSPFCGGGSEVQR